MKFFQAKSRRYLPSKMSRDAELYIDDQFNGVLAEKIYRLNNYRRATYTFVVRWNAQRTQKNFESI